MIPQGSTRAAVLLTPPLSPRPVWRDRYYRAHIQILYTGDGEDWGCLVENIKLSFMGLNDALDTY